MYYLHNMNENFNLVGPIEPSGLSWLVNCLLELNVRVSQSPDIWNFENGMSQVKKNRQELSRWLPALEKHDRKFKFAPGKSVTWSHDWPAANHIGTKTLVFTRDPRMALYSGYKRNAEPGTTFREYLLEIDPQWLLNRMQLWSLFHLLWSTHPQVHWFFFEDYKKDPVKLLSSVLDELGIDNCSEEDVLNAVASSSWQRAREAEVAFKSNLNSDEKVMIRKGSVDLENAEEEKTSYEMIQNLCSPIYFNITKTLTLQQYIDQSPLWPYYVEYIRKHLNVSESSHVSGLLTHRHINPEAISINSSGRNEVIGSLIRKITKDYFGDLRFLINQKFPNQESSKKKLFVKLLNWMFQITKRKIRHKINLRFRRNRQAV